MHVQPDRRTLQHHPAPPVIAALPPQRRQPAPTYEEAPAPIRSRRRGPAHLPRPGSSGSPGSVGHHRPSGLEGEGFPVRRAFAGVDLRALDPFVHMDQMGEVDYAPGEPKGTPWHPLAAA
jgi:quercetin 2,3-dioxygenase